MMKRLRYRIALWISPELQRKIEYMALLVESCEAELVRRDNFREES